MKTTDRSQNAHVPSNSTMAFADASEATAPIADKPANVIASILRDSRAGIVTTGQAHLANNGQMALPITVTDAAARAIRDAAATPAEATLRLSISPAFEYDLRLDTLAEGDVAVVTGGITVLLDADSASRADGLTLDFVAAGPANEGGFTIENPNAPAPIQQMTAGELKALLDSGQPFMLLDVRTPAERAIAAIDGSRLLDQALHDELMQGDRRAPLVFQCHHGIRSQAAAEYFRRAGFTRLYNLAGGIDTWSIEIDPSVPRY